MTYKWDSVTFLDFSISTTPEGKLSSTLFRKVTAGNTVLHADSFHPVPLKNSIPYGQYLRLRRNCSNDSLFIREAQNLQGRLLARGYSRSCLKKAYNQTIRQSQSNLLSKSKSPMSSDSNPTRIAMHYSRQHVAIKNILQRHWNILTDDPKLRHFVSNQPAITYKRATSIKDRLVQSQYKNENKRSKHCSVVGSFLCGHCSYCPLIRKEESFHLPNGETFRPTHFVNCQTRGVVYFMECECGTYYVGKTKQEFWKRISKHM